MYISKKYPHVVFKRENLDSLLLHPYTYNPYLNSSNPQNRRHRTVQWTVEPIKLFNRKIQVDHCQTLRKACEKRHATEKERRREEEGEYDEGRSERWTSNCSGELIRVGCGCCVRPCPRVQEGAHRPLSIAASDPASFPSLSSRSHPLTLSRALLSLSLCRFLHRMILILSSRASRTGSLNGGHFNLHYVRPRIAEGLIKFLLSRTAFSEAGRLTTRHRRTRHLSNGLSALSRVAPRWELFIFPGAKCESPEIVFPS